MKNRRHKKILEVIKDNVITTQDQLLDYLKSNGFNVTQATVSRDIKELRLIKTTDINSNQRYIVLEENNRPSPKYSDIFSSSVITISNAMNDIVIKCYAGMANAACAALDSMEFSEVVGTLAGDDTIFVITQNEYAAETLVEKLNKIKLEGI